MRQLAQAACGFQRLKAVSRPLIPFLAGAMLFAMMRPAERDREFVADLLPKSARLRKAKMVRVGRFAAADRAMGFRPRIDSQTGS